MPTLRDEFDRTYEKGGFTYVSWSQVADRLDDAAPGWAFEIRQLGDDWCWGRLTIDGRTFDNIGYAENASADWKKEALKDAVSDALKRCAALAGVARYLYDKDAPVGRSNGHSAQVAARPVAVAQRSSTALPTNAEAIGAIYDELGNLDFDSLPTTRPVAVAERPAATNRAALSEGENWCPVHQLAWKLIPAGTNKAGKAYGAFWSCSSKDKPFCTEKPTSQWIEAHR